MLSLFDRQNIAVRVTSAVRAVKVRYVEGGYLSHSEIL